MKKSILALAVCTLLGLTASLNAQITVINFDTPANWTAGSGGITSYQSNHVYTESGWSFTGGPALRETSATVDGFSGFLGTYAWRLRDAAVTWTATYTQALAPAESFSAFGFDARRWDGSPSPAYTVSYSVNGGVDWTTATAIGTAGVLDNAAFVNSNWSTFAQTVSTTQGLAANQFVVRFSATGGERIMVDNFSATVIPEPSTYAAILGLLGIGFAAYYRRRK